MSSQVDQAYQRIRQGILNGTYKTSQRLVENELANTLGIGRHGIRAALQQLGAEGLVKMEPHRGASVATVTLEEGLAILLAREALEGMAARLAANNIDDEGIGKLRQLLAEIEDAAEQGLPKAYSTANSRFHTLILEIANSPKISEMIDSLQSRIVRLRFRTALIPGRMAASLEEHRAIGDAIIESDGDRAEAAMRRHISSVRKTIAECWELLGS